MEKNELDKDEFALCDLEEVVSPTTSGDAPVIGIIIGVIILAA